MKYAESIPLPCPVPMFHPDEFYYQAWQFADSTIEPQVIRPGRNGMTNWRPARKNPSCAAIGAWRCLVSWDDGLVGFPVVLVGGGWRMRFLQFLWLMRKRVWAWSPVEYELASAAKLWFEGIFKVVINPSSFISGQCPWTWPTTPLNVMNAISWRISRCGTFGHYGGWGKIVTSVFL